LKFIERPIGQFIDRKKNEPQLEPIDVIMSTLDAENFLEKSLYSIYREIPVRKLIICDGGSKDDTIKILKSFTRVELYVKPEIRTTGKVIEFLISHTETEWFVIIDGDIVLGEGWYDEMKKHRDKIDVIENSQMILAYHMYQDFKNKLEKNARAQDLCHLIKRKAIENYQCDDDYMWRFTDYLLRQTAEKSGFSYGKVNTTYHIHNETERIPYESDNEKNFQKIILKKPEYVIIDKKKEEEANIKHAKAVVKYLDPENPAVRHNKGMGYLIRVLERNWVKENGPQWLKVYDNTSLTKLKIKRFIIKILKK